MAENAPSSAQAAPHRPAPTFVDPILVEGSEGPDDAEARDADVDPRDAAAPAGPEPSSLIDEPDDDGIVFESDARSVDGANQSEGGEAAVDDGETADDDESADDGETVDDDETVDDGETVDAGEAVDGDEAVDEAAGVSTNESDTDLDADLDAEPDEAEGETIDGDEDEATRPRASGDVLATEAGPRADVWRPAGATVTPRQPDRDLHFGAATAAGLSTMTPFARVTEAPHRELGGAVLEVEGLTKQFGSTTAVNDVSFHVRKGSFFGIVGPNGAGKTTTLSMVTGMLRPSTGKASVLGVDVWREAAAARSHIGILPDRLRLFDQLTGAQLLYYTGVLRGLPADEARERTASLLDAFEIGTSADRLVVDYSAGMTKKIALASSLIHSPELLVLDEPFESIDPVSAGQLTDILFEYVRRGGTVMLSSHSMDLVQRVCDHVAVIVRGEILAEGTVADVRGDITLEERFRDIVRGPRQTEGLDWLGISFS